MVIKLRTENNLIGQCEFLRIICSSFTCRIFRLLTATATAHYWLPIANLL